MTKSILIALIVEAVRTPEMSVNFYDTIWRNIPEGCHLHFRRRENLKSHLILYSFDMNLGREKQQFIILV
jgi:hypothetical protein